MGKKNTMPIRVDAEIFLPEVERFKEKNHLDAGFPSVTKEIGKLMRELRVEQKEFKLKRKEQIIKF